MPDFILLMHNDSIDSVPDEAWPHYLSRLQAKGIILGGSAIGRGMCVRKAGPPSDVSAHLTGFIRVLADNLDHAAALVEGNPVFESGGTIEIRELPVTS